MPFTVTGSPGMKSQSTYAFEMSCEPRDPKKDFLFLNRVVTPITFIFPADKNTDLTTGRDDTARELSEAATPAPATISSDRAGFASSSCLSNAGALSPHFSREKVLFCKHL